MLVLVENGSVKTFPYTLHQLRKDNPRTSFPKNPSNALLEKYGVYPVAEDTIPTVGFGEVLERNAEPALVEGTWVIGWSVRSMSPEELEQRRSLMTMKRADFAISAFEAGIISGSEAEQWAGGSALPAAVVVAFDEMILDPAEKLKARIEALTAPNVNRMNSLVLILQQNLSLTDEEVDDLFTSSGT